MQRVERSEEKTFEFPFADCRSYDANGNSNCDDWITRGKYNTRLNEDGNEVLDFAISVIAPDGFQLSSDTSKASIYLSSYEDDEIKLTEFFACRWLPGQTDAECGDYLSFNSLEEWH